MSTPSTLTKRAGAKCRASNKTGRSGLRAAIENPLPTPAHFDVVNHDGTLDATGSSILEGIGIRRITANFARAKLDFALRGTDAEAIAMVHHLLRHDGLFVGGSAGLNCVGAVKLARKLGPGKVIATILCDSAARGASRLFNDAWLAEKGFATTTTTDRSFVA